MILFIYFFIIIIIIIIFFFFFFGGGQYLTILVMSMESSIASIQASMIITYHIYHAYSLVTNNV